MEKKMENEMETGVRLVSQHGPQYIIILMMDIHLYHPYVSQNSNFGEAPQGMLALKGPEACPKGRFRAVSVTWRVRGT